MPAKRRNYESQLSFHRVSSKVSDACSFKSLLKAPYVFRKANVQPYVMSGKEHSVLYSGSTLDHLQSIWPVRIYRSPDRFRLDEYSTDLMAHGGTGVIISILREQVRTMKKCYSIVL